MTQASIAAVHHMTNVLPESPSQASIPHWHDDQDSRDVASHKESYAKQHDLHKHLQGQWGWNRQQSGSSGGRWALLNKDTCSWSRIKTDRSCDCPCAFSSKWRGPFLKAVLKSLKLKRRTGIILHLQRIGAKVTTLMSWNIFGIRIDIKQDADTVMIFFIGNTIHGKSRLRGFLSVYLFVYLFI